MAFLALSTNENVIIRSHISSFRLPPLQRQQHCKGTHANHGVPLTETVRHYGDTATSFTEIANPHIPRFPQHATQAASALVPTRKAYGIDVAKCLQIPASVPTRIPAGCLQPCSAGRYATASAVWRWHIRRHPACDQFHLQSRDTRGWWHAAIRARVP